MMWCGWPRNPLKKSAQQPAKEDKALYELLNYGENKAEELIINTI